jgi:hypothetical protein
VPINPDFSALEAVITAKVESVATNIDNKDLLIQMKALEAAVANLALTKVIAEGTYQQGQVTLTASTAIGSLNTAVTNAEDALDLIVTTAEGNLSDAADAALLSFTTTSDAVLATINGLLDQLGETNVQDIIDLVTQSLSDITDAATAASEALTQLQQDAVGVISGAGTSALDNAVSGINTARDAAILAVSASGDLTNQINFIRNDRWLGLNIFAPTSGN